MNLVRNLTAVFAFFMCCSVGSVSAGLIDVVVVDGDTLDLTLSGTITGPIGSTGILFVDIPNLGGPNSGALGANISGNAMIGDLPIDSVYVGYNNAPFGETLQIRGSANGSLNFNIGDVLSGMATVTFSSAHGLTQNIFDASPQVYWGSNSNQGAASSGSTNNIPLPGTVPLFAIGLVAAGLRRKKKPYLN